MKDGSPDRETAVALARVDARTVRQLGVRALPRTAPRRLVLDRPPDARVLEEALKRCQGKAVINSINSLRKAGRLIDRDRGAYPV